MEVAYICEQMNDILGSKMSVLDYRLKYAIVYGFMPRPSYLDELKSVFEITNNPTHKRKLKVKKSECPKLFQQKDKAFIINGSKYSSPYIGKDEEDTPCFVFYNFVELDRRNVEVIIPHCDYSRLFYKRKKKLLWGVPEIEIKYHMLYKLKYVVDRIKTCKMCKELYKRENRKPTKKITKITKSNMAWELIKDDPERWFTELYMDGKNIKTTWNSIFDNVTR